MVAIKQVVASFASALVLVASTVKAQCTSNTWQGTSALAGITSGCQNTAIGYHALEDLQTGSQNTAIGYQAMQDVEPSVPQGIAVGAFAMRANEGDNAIGIGSSALEENTGDFNIGIGPSALQSGGGEYNIAIGSLAMEDSTGGAENIAVGVGSLHTNASGNSNIAIGTSALYGTDDGSDNVAIGTAALAANIGGDESVAIGGNALANNTAGENVAVGYDALATSSSGTSNVAVGHDALKATTTGGSNTALGYGALDSNTTSNANVAVGYLALATTTTNGSSTAVGAAALPSATGTGNIALGAFAGWSITSGGNNITIGNLGTSGDSNTIRIGTQGSHTAAYLAGVSSSTIASGTQVLVSSSGQLGIPTSSARFKQDVADMGSTSDGLLKLRPVRFKYRSEIDPTGLEQYGLVAEEVARIYPDLVTYNDKGEPEAIRYHFINTMLLNEVQKQARQIEMLQRGLEAQASELAALSARVQSGIGLQPIDLPSSEPIGHPVAWGSAPECGRPADL